MPYGPRAAEHTVLHRIVRMHLATFLAAAERDGGVPPFVEREFRQFVDCGVGPGLRPVSVRWLR